MVPLGLDPDQSVRQGFHRILTESLNIVGYIDVKTVWIHEPRLNRAFAVRIMLSYDADYSMMPFVLKPTASHNQTAKILCVAIIIIYLLQYCN